jgi:Tol biopolymer transport system component
MLRHPRFAIAAALSAAVLLTTSANSPPGAPPLPAKAGTILYSRTGGAADGTIWTANADGSGDHQITVGDVPRLSPNGKMIVFLKGGGTANFARGNVWVRKLSNGAETLIYPNGDFVVNFSWTPDSQHILFDFGCGINRMDPDGSNIVPLFGADCFSDAPTVSPDGSQFAFHNQFNGIGLANIDGSNKHMLAGTVNGVWPTWSPDGKLISFFNLSDHNLYRIKPDGSGMKKLTNLTAPDAFTDTALWTGDGASLIAAGTIGGVTGLWVVPAAGGTPTGPIALRAGADPFFAGTFAAKPSLVSASPGSGARGTTVATTLTGTAFGVGATVTFPAGSGVSLAGAPVVKSSTTIKAKFKIDAGAPAGGVKVTVTNPGAQKGSCTCFTVTP